jgi:hypothetical protein
MKQNWLLPLIIGKQADQRRKKFTVLFLTRPEATPKSPSLALAKAEC